MYPPLVERWTIAIAAAESAIVAAVRAHVFSAHDASDARRLLREEARWLAGAARR